MKSRIIKTISIIATAIAAAMIFGNMRTAPQSFVAVEWSREAGGFRISPGKTGLSNFAGKPILEVPIAADLNKNGFPESYTLQDKSLQIAEQGKELWKTPAAWRIDGFVLADSNNDGRIDLNMSVWKPGNYGPSKPFWVQRDDRRVRNHFFVFDAASSSVRPVWQSSNLEAPNCEFLLADLDGDNQNELVTIEGEYSFFRSCAGRFIAVWKWNGWGFSNEWRSPQGSFRRLFVNRADDRVQVSAESRPRSVKRLLWSN